MKKKNRLPIILVILLGSVSTWLILHNTNSTIKQELKDFAVADPTVITKIHLKDKANKEVTLEKMPDKSWKVNGKYKVRPDVIRTLLYTIKSIRVRNPVGKRAMENVIKELATGATKVQIFEDDKLIKEYYVGGETQDDEGTYMLLQDPETGANSSVPFVLCIPGFNGYVSGRYFTDETNWRARNIFKYAWNEIKTINVDYAVKKDSSFTLNVLGENNFEVINAAGKKIENLDTGRVKQYLGYFTDLQFEGIDKIKQSTKDSIMKLGWVHAVKVTDVKGKSVLLRTYRKPAPHPNMTTEKGDPLMEDTDRMYAIMDGNDKEILLIQYFVFGKIFMPTSYFLHKKMRLAAPKK